MRRLTVTAIRTDSPPKYPWSVMVSPRFTRLVLATHDHALSDHRHAFGGRGLFNSKMAHGVVREQKLRNLL